MEKTAIDPIEINYEIKDMGLTAHCLTPCPFNAKIKVGSGRCKRCEHLVASDDDLKVVTCKCQGGTDAPVEAQPGERPSFEQFMQDIGMTKEDAERASRLANKLRGVEESALRPRLNFEEFMEAQGVDKETREITIDLAKRLGIDPEARDIHGALGKLGGIEEMIEEAITDDMATQMFKAMPENEQQNMRTELTNLSIQQITESIEEGIKDTGKMFGDKYSTYKEKVLLGVRGNINQLLAKGDY